MEIDVKTEELTKIVRDELLEMLRAPWKASRMAIGKFKGVQVQLVFTKEKEDFCDNKVGSKIVSVKAT